jgi:hypothetical protein
MLFPTFLPTFEFRGAPSAERAENADSKPLRVPPSAFRGCLCIQCYEFTHFFVVAVGR